MIETDNTISISRFKEFDQYGRPKEYEQVTDGNSYVSKYTYNLSGALIEEQYPSLRVVQNDFDGNGDLSRIYGNATPTATERTYANSFKYTPDGRIERLKIGNGLWEKAAFNDRLQVTEMGLGHGVQNLNLWKLNFGYDEDLGSANTANTGNLVSQTITVDGIVKPFIQTYKYDALYRITEAEEKNDNNQTWIETYGYDSYGNRTALSQNITGNPLTLNSTTHPTIDPLTNRFNSSQGYLYDKVGNLTTDEDDTGLSRDIVFNGDNKQKEIRDDATGNKIGEYEYDGNGKRVKKKVYGSNETLLETVIFVYSGGKLIEEYSTKAPPQNPTTKYVATDTLQSVRAISNQDGQVISRRDFLPFGQEIPNADDPGHSASLRISALKYGADDVRQKFTGYQKDEESGLDFAEARMYNNHHARFTAVDPLLASGKSRDPQSFNRYVYVMNSPLNFTDPTGLQVAQGFCVNCRPLVRDSDGALLRSRPGDTIPEGYSPVTQTQIHYGQSGQNSILTSSTIMPLIIAESTEPESGDVREQTQSILSEIFSESALSTDNNVAVGIGQGITNGARGIPNSPWETDIIGGPLYTAVANAMEGQGLTFLPRTTPNSYGFPSPFTYEQPQNLNQQVGQFAGQLTFVAATVAATRGAGARFGSPGFAFSMRNGYGPLGKKGLNIGSYRIDMLYRTPTSGPASGGIFSVKQNVHGGNLFRLEKGIIHKSNDIRYHTQIRFTIFGKKYGSTAQRRPLTFRKF